MELVALGRNLREFYVIFCSIIAGSKQKVFIKTQHWHLNPKVHHLPGTCGTDPCCRQGFGKKERNRKKSNLRKKQKNDLQLLLQFEGLRCHYSLAGIEEISDGDQ